MIAIEPTVKLAQVREVFVPGGLGLLGRAFTRRAWLAEERQDPSPANHHEPLEHLGDAWLGAIITCRLFREHPTASEKDLSRGRESLVSTVTLAQIGRELGLVSFLRAGNGERQQGQIGTDKSLASHVEAIVGAAWAHGGPSAVERVVEILYEGRWPVTLTGDNHSDYKGKLARAVQGIDRSPGLEPRYKELERRGPDHMKEFRAGVTLSDGRSFEGQWASSLQKAEQDAARVALVEAIPEE